MNKVKITFCETLEIENDSFKIINPILSLKTDKMPFKKSLSIFIQLECQMNLNDTFNFIFEDPNGEPLFYSEEKIKDEIIDTTITMGARLEDYIFSLPGEYVAKFILNEKVIAKDTLNIRDEVN